jgi:hypothetical protein
MLVQPQERLLSQHLQAWFAGGGSSRWRSTKTLTIGTDAVSFTGIDKSLER